jgi:hypothetical protein
MPEEAIPYCQQTLAASPKFLLAHVDLTADNAWLGRESEAKAALAELLKVNPRFTRQAFISIGRSFSDNAVFTQQISRIADGLRKAGMPEE